MRNGWASPIRAISTTPADAWPNWSPTAATPRRSAPASTGPAWPDRGTAADRNGPPIVSDRVGPHLAGPDANGLVHGGHPDLAVADLARAGGAGDDLDHLLRLAGLDQHL